MKKIAVIQTGGKQYLVRPGESLKIEKIAAEKDGKVFFDKVLLMTDGPASPAGKENVKLGKPFIDDAKISAKIIGEGRGKKVIVVKYKQKTRYHKKAGHRQPFTKITISDF
jgi:large subunit ribosomal protein L21